MITEVPDAEGHDEFDVKMRCLREFSANANICADDFLLDAVGAETLAVPCAGVVLQNGDETRAATLLAAGIPSVFLGEAALLDGKVVQRLLAAYGEERIGIVASLRRKTVSWEFETTSNADFKTLTPSVCEASFEVLRADGDSSGILASWWLLAMRDLGVTQFLVRANIRDNADLNLCAGLVESFGAALWLAPLSDCAPPLEDWIVFGQARQLALPESLYLQRDILQAQFRKATA